MPPCPALRARFCSVPCVFVAMLIGLLGPRSVRAATPAPGSVRIADRESVQLLDAAGALVGTLKIPTSHAVSDALRVGNVLYVACGPDGVLAFDLADAAGPRLVSRFAAGRNAVRLAVSGSQLLVIVAEYGALTYSLSDPQHPTASAMEALDPLRGQASALPTAQAVPSPAASPASTAVGNDAAPSAAPAAPRPIKAVPEEAARQGTARVTKVATGWVAIASNDPISVGDRFVLRSQRLVRTVDPTTGRSERRPSNEPLGQFAVERIYPPSSENGRALYVASGRLLRGTVTRVGDVAQPTSDPLREPLYVPRLWYGMFRFVGHLRPMFGVSPLAFAMLNDFRFEYYLPVPLKVGVSVAPLGFMTNSPIGVLSEVRGHIGFSSSYFELSLDPGAILNRLGGTAFSFGFSLRLGSLDGLNLIFRSGYRLLSTGSRQPDFGFYNAGGEINIPLAKRFTLHLAGEGASAYFWGTLGLKYWLRGNGGPGTLILDSGVGGAYLDDQCRAIDSSSTTCNNPSVSSSFARAGGPLASLGLDARF